MSLAFGKPSKKAEQRGLVDVHLEVRRSQVVAMVGANGSGKSSLLRAIAGYVPAVGTVTLDGVRIDGQAAWGRARSVAYIDQQSGIGLPEHLQVMEVLALWATRGSAPFSRPLRSPLLSEAWEALARLAPQLTDRLGDPVGSLSGGERQLLSLVCLETALALGVNGPCPLGVVLLDEHTAALDPEREHAVFSATRALVLQHHLAALAVCHDERSVDKWADGAVFVQQDGRVARLEDRREPGWFRRVLASGVGAERSLPGVRGPREYID